MSSPQIELMVFFSASTGAPLTGLTPTFLTYVNVATGAPISQPSITEVGGGAYKFTPVLTSGVGVYYLVDAGATAANRYCFRLIRPEDFFPDLIETILQYEQGRWKIHTTGPDANRLVIYDTDDTTVLKKFDLFDSAGSPTTSQPYERVPV